MHEASDLLGGCVSGAEWCVGPAIEQRESGEPGRIKGKGSAIKRAEALGIGESVLSLDIDFAGRSDDQSAVGGVAQVNRDIDVGRRAVSCWKRKKLRAGSARHGALELDYGTDFLD